MKNKVLHTIISAVLVIIILLPFTIQVIHLSHRHEYKICDVKNTEHIHQHKLDCSNYHQIIEHNSIDFSSNLNLIVHSFGNQNHNSYHQSLYTTALQLKSSRAPPFFIV